MSRKGRSRRGGWKGGEERGRVKVWFGHVLAFPRQQKLLLEPGKLEGVWGNDRESLKMANLSRKNRVPVSVAEVWVWNSSPVFCLLGLDSQQIMITISLHYWIMALDKEWQTGRPSQLTKNRRLPNRFLRPMVPWRQTNKQDMVNLFEFTDTFWQNGIQFLGLRLRSNIHDQKSKLFVHSKS